MNIVAIFVILTMIVLLIKTMIDTIKNKEYPYLLIVVLGILILLSLLLLVLFNI